MPDRFHGQFRGGLASNEDRSEFPQGVAFLGQPQRRAPMPRENSFSDSDGRSLTPDLEDENIQAFSPTYTTQPELPAPVAAKPAALRVTTAVSPSKHSLHSGISAKHSLHSARSAPRARVQSRPARPGAFTVMSPRQKFKSAVRKVIALHRTSTIIGGRGFAGAEPGVNPRDSAAEVEYGHIKQDCIIQVIDYSAVRSSFGRMTNKEFVAIMESPEASTREPWVKVRWINIAGISWDVIKAVSLRYDLHPLALEDVFHARSQTRSKADYYTKHLFLRILCHELRDVDSDKTVQWAEGSTLVDNDPMSFSSSGELQDNDYKDTYELEGRENGLHQDDSTVYDSANSRLNSLKVSRRARRRRPVLPQSSLDTGAPTRPMPSRSKTTSTLNFKELQKILASSSREPISPDDLKVEALKRGDRVNVKVSPMFIFLLRDGTVISMHSTPTEDLTAPIVSRLKQRDTGLRSSADPSLLAQSLLDLIVDKALEVIDEYHVKIKKFEGEVLLKPKMKTVRNLHILSGDLILHKRTLDPIKTVIYGLRRYDLDRAAAIVDMSDAANKDIKIQGWMSHKSKIYLADVHDHMDYILTSLDMFTGIAENLIDYTFNMASYEMNEVMRRLTLATIVFLPLTLTTGYFGMNFEHMSSVQDKSEWVFWFAAIPLSCLIIPIFIFPDLQRGFHLIQKRLFTRKLAKFAQD